MVKHRDSSPFEPKVYRFVVVVLAALFLSNLAWLIFRFSSDYLLQRKYLATMGLVVDVAQGKSEDNSSTEYRFPIIEFQTEEGKTIVFKDKKGSPDAEYRPGQLVPILYNKEKPYIALVDLSSTK